MAKLKLTTQEKKLRRNKAVLVTYNEAKQRMTTREAQEWAADQFDLSKDTVIKILFDPTYSNSPLPKTIATPVVQTACQLT